MGLSEQKCDEEDEQGRGSGDTKGRNVGSNEPVTVDRASEYIRGPADPLERLFWADKEDVANEKEVQDCSEHKGPPGAAGAVSEWL